MSAKARRTEFGDFQTPPSLAGSVCDVLLRTDLKPGSIVEPTCGTGSFLKASVRAFPEAQALFGFDVNPEHLRAARSAVPQATIRCEEFFGKDWMETLDGLPEPILVIGNPPWVTNSAVGSIGGTNLPVKSNFLGLSGFDAVTGKSNFDISEWMLMCLLRCLSTRSATLAMLCKTAVARKVLRHAWMNNIEVTRSATYKIDALAEFGAAVDACLLVWVFESGKCSRQCDVYPAVDKPCEPTSTFALRGERLVADLEAYTAYGHLSGTSPRKWRSGIKHDCSRIMELRPTHDGLYVNGLGETVELERDFLFPMLKSSELANGDMPSRCMLVPQKAIGEDTGVISSQAPLTWHYLESHGKMLDSRSSTIYRSRPRFSVFGVGEYSFTEWKVAISGFYKRLDFRCVGPFDGKCVVLDDTCYFLPCHSEDEARRLASILNSKEAKGLFNSLVFWDAKRPITASLLSSLDLGRLATELGVADSTETAELSVTFGPADARPTRQHFESSTMSNH